MQKILDWLFNKPTPVPDPLPEPLNPSKIALLFGTNYVGTSHALYGCINDVNDMQSKLNKEFPEFVVRKFTGSQVRFSTFYNEIKKALLAGKAGDHLIIWYSGHGTQLVSNHEPDGYCEALYLEDGPFSDDIMMELQSYTPDGMIVEANFDSCFSGGMYKSMNPHGLSLKTRNRFIPIMGVPIMTKRVSSIVKGPPKWVVKSGCGEGQTSADAWFNGRANGAYTYFALKCFSKGVSFIEEMDKIHTHLPGNGFYQRPLLLGNSVFFNYKY